ncbi:MAG: fibronectin type III domain-containing protein [Vicinamibacterales bacterium]
MMRFTRPLLAWPALLAGALLLMTTAGPGVHDTRATAAPRDDHGGLRARFVNEPSSVPFIGSDLGGAPAATITVTYNGFTAQSQAAFQRAVDIWASVITSSVPIRVSATMSSLDPGVLGSAGSNSIWRDFSGAPASGTWFPDALADKLAGQDLSAGQPDIVANFTTDPSINWYFGTDANPGANQFDFVTVVLHELGHGLGFFGSADVSGGAGTWGQSGRPYIYDRYVKTGGGQSIISFATPSAALAATLQGGSLFFASPVADGGAISAPARLYAPGAWESGSSYSHLDEGTYVSGNAQSLMTPQLSMMEAIHDPGSITREIFADMGWTVGSSPAPTPGGTPGTPTNVQVSVNGTTSLTVTWSAPSSGATPTSYLVDFSVTPGGAPAARVASGTTSTSVNIPAGTTGTFYASVTALNGSTAGTASSPVAFTIGSAGPGPCTSAPPAPTGLTGGVSGGVASVSWTASAGATSYVVQAGSASGGTNIFNANVGANTAVSAAVPAGFSAFVQVLAVNACGTSGPSTPISIAGDGGLNTVFSGFRPGR